jgi:cytoskeletal protein CcmA (bactofilin family)
MALSESYIAPEVSIEGRIEGSGNLRVAGRVKGTVTVAGEVTIEPRALIDGEVKAGSLTVEPGACMRGTVEFGWTGDAAHARSRHERSA